MKKSTFQVCLTLALAIVMFVGNITKIQAQRLNQIKLNDNTTTLNTNTTQAVQLQEGTAEAQTRSKCAECARYDKESEDYTNAGCRALEGLCENLGRGGGGPIIIGTSDTMAVESTSANNRKAEILYYEKFDKVVVALDGLKKTYQNVTTTVEVFGSNKKLLYSSAKKPVKHYTFNKKNNKLMSLKGEFAIKKLSPAQNDVLAVSVKLRKMKPQKGMVKVTVKAMNPKTRKMMTIQTLGKNVYLK